jgi:DNA-binding LacI/PurR family transcriptional regulator
VDSSVVTLSGFGARGEKAGLGEHGMTPTRMAEILRSRGIRALIFGAPRHLRSLLPFETSGFAAVAINLDPTRDHLHRATADDLGNTSKALKALRTFGYRRAGLAIDEETIALMLLFPRMAFLEFEETLPRADRAGCWIGPIDDLTGFTRWLVDCKPDAIVTVNVYRQWWLQSLGFRIPQDIGVAQLDPDFVPSPVSGIDGRFDVIGRNAADLLISQINRQEFDAPADPIHVMNDGI